MTEQTQHKKRMSAWIRRILLAVIGVIIGVNAYLANAKGIGHNQMPMPFGYGFANVLSGSMEPTFSKGTLLLVKQTEQLNVGDIAVYQSENKLIVHRIISLDGDTVTTQGDANNTADEPFPKTEVKGIVIAEIPYLGTVLGLFRTPAGILGILICAFLLVEGSFRRQQDEDDQELEAIKEEIRRLKEEK